MNMTTISGKVLGLAVRSESRAPMTEIEEADAMENGTLSGNAKVKVDRGVSLLSREQWETVNQELDSTLPWHARRANILIEGLQLSETIGKTLLVGSAEVEIKAETTPCALMEEICPGLRKVLEPDCRGGVSGRVVRSGQIRVGDVIHVRD